MTQNTYSQNMEFEAEVRRVAEAVWSLNPGDCQPNHYGNDNIISELDGIARLRDITHLIMATTSTKLDKAKSDIKKLNAAENIERKKSPAVSKWFITQKQLDAQHIDIARKNNVTVLTLDQFRRRFFDGRKYISRRNNAPFGSARDPLDNTTTIKNDAYVQLPIYKQDFVNVRNKKDSHKELREKLVDVKYIVNLISKGHMVVLLAPFGAGKSLTTREIFTDLSNSYQAGKSNATPISLNLREHWGQSLSDEILERHARSIGYTPKEDLVIAWRSGMSCLLLDGFDEVASQSVIRTDDKNFMRDARRSALVGVRDFLTKVPSGIGVFVCGRDHYFDTIQELDHSLGISGRDYTLLRLDEFTEEGANEFLQRNGIHEPLPDWLPRKPLLLSYLLHRELFHEILKIDSSRGFGYAWDNFLTRIAEREASLEYAVMDPNTIRAVLERLAFTVRAKSSGSGPITGIDLSEAYYAETSQSAGEGVLAQLQRLPGLTQREQDPGLRSFVDEDMLSALQGSAFSRLILGQYQGDLTVPLSQLSEKAIAMATYLLNKNDVSLGTVISVAENLNNSTTISKNSKQSIADCIAISLNIAIDKEENHIHFRNIVIDSANFGELNLEDIQVSGLVFKNCTITEIVLGTKGASGNVYFTDCIISKVSGVAGNEYLPEKMFADNCTIENFDNMATNNAVLQLDIPPQTKALMTILRKLYQQAGRGRKFSALRRGITQPEVLSYIDKVIEVLERHGFVSIFNKVIHPVRKQSSRAGKILGAPTLCDDPVVSEVNKL